VRIILVVFSQTGNTKKIARRIQKGIQKSSHSCEITSLKEASSRQLNRFDIFGIGCPTFFYREPVNVRDFIRAIDEMPDKHAFIFCTHGSIMGNTLYYMADELQKKGLSVIGSFDTYADTSLQFYPEIMHTTGHPDEIELDAAEKFGEVIVDVSAQVRRGERALPSFALTEDTWWARTSEKLTPDILRKYTPTLTINTTLCTECMLCQDNCPVDAINLDARPPEIQREGCIFCWFCEKICPAGAIEADWSMMRDQSRRNLVKYIEILKEAEEQGTFRPYVDYEKIF